MNKIKVFSTIAMLLSLSQYAEAGIPKISARLSKTTIKANEQLSVSFTLLSDKGRRITQPSGNVSLLNYSDAACSSLSGEIGTPHNLSLSLSKSYTLQPGEYYIKPEISGYSSSGCQKLTVLDPSIPFERLSLSRGAFSQGRYSFELKWESNSGALSGSANSKALVSLYSDESCSQKISKTRISSVSPANGRSIFSLIRPALPSVFAKASSGLIFSSCVSLPDASGGACTLANANIPHAFSVSGTLVSGCTLDECSENYTKSGNSCSPTVCTTSDVSNSSAVTGTKVSGCSASSCVTGFNRVQNSQTQLYSCVANSAPVASNGSASLNEDSSAQIVLSASDADGESLSYSIVSQPTHGVLSGSGADRTYTPDANYYGSDSFTFKASDGIANSGSATVLITVNAVNDAPVSVGQSVSTDEDTAKSIVLSASDIDSVGALSYIVVTQPVHGTLSGSAPNVTYTPDSNYNGSDSFTFKANDGSLDSNVATVSITVNLINDAPVISGNINDNLNEDTVAYELVPFSSITSDTDSSSLNWIIVTPPAHGTLSGVDGSAIRYYTPAANYNGSDSFVIKANDGLLDSNLFTIELTVNPVNDAPVSSGQILSTNEDISKEIVLSASDIDLDSLTYTVVSQPANGTISGSGSNLTYTPAANYNGLDSFTFKVNDGSVDSNISTVSISVAAGNDAPVALAQSVSATEDVAKAITLSASDVDAGSSLTYTVVSQPTSGVLSGTAPNLTYTPTANYNGSDSFTFKANDGSLDSNLATVSITVNAVNDAPVALADSYATTATAGSQLSIPVSSILSNDTDVDNTSPLASNFGLTVSSVASASTGTVSLSGSNILFTPSISFNGNATFSYTISDGSLTSSALVTVPVVCASGYTNSSGTCVPSLPTPTIDNSFLDYEGIISAGYGYSCSIKTDGNISCWGKNDMNQLGNDSGLDSLIPVTFSWIQGASVSLFGSFSGISNITSGYYHSCAVSGERVYCWGRNSEAQLGDGTLDSPGSSTVKDSTGSYLTGIKESATGFSHTCALTLSGGVKCWGYNANGELGRGNLINDQVSNYKAGNVVTSATNSNPLAGIISISSKSAHTCAVTSSGGVKCWGYNANGELGDGTTISRSSPVDVLSNGVGSAPLSGIVSVSAGASHTCALTSSGGVKCWGLNTSGQLGSLVDALRLSPTNVVTSEANSTPISGIISISAGETSTCALTSSRSVKCWGNNYYGELGTGNTVTSFAPIDVRTSSTDSTPLSNVASIASGVIHHCAVLTSGGIRCWGGDNGQFDGSSWIGLGLGNGIAANSLVPVTVTGFNTSGANNSPKNLVVVGSCYGNTVKHSPASSSLTNFDAQCVSNKYIMKLSSALINNVFTGISSPNRVIRVYDYYNSNGVASSLSTSSSVSWP